MEKKIDLLRRCCSDTLYQYLNSSQKIILQMGIHVVGISASIILSSYSLSGVPDGVRISMICPVVG